MRIKAHVTEVSDHGDKLKVTGQGRQVGKSNWRPWLSISIDMPISKTNRKAFYIGRHFELKVKPE
jgi:hypothetical protein